MLGIGRQWLSPLLPGSLLGCQALYLTVGVMYALRKIESIDQGRMNMPSVAELSELQAAQTDLNQLKEQNSESYAAMAELFRKHRKIGYKNICKMLLGEATPEKLKGLV
ncbi:MAG: hypothetical protein HN368_08175 [Spirochaetales bacterium]|jgi:hypothetical protein|nr:hypothetical protein [Spirochaetales bacterium]